MERTLKTCHPSVKKTGLKLGEERYVPRKLILAIYSHGDYSCEGIEKREFGGEYRGKPKKKLWRRLTFLIVKKKQTQKEHERVILWVKFYINYGRSCMSKGSWSIMRSNLEMSKKYTKKNTWLW